MDGHGPEVHFQKHFFIARIDLKMALQNLAIFGSLRVIYGVLLSTLKTVLKNVSDLKP